MFVWVYIIFLALTVDRLRVEHKHIKVYGVEEQLSLQFCSKKTCGHVQLKAILPCIFLIQ